MKNLSHIFAFCLCTLLVNAQQSSTAQKHHFTIKKSVSVEMSQVQSDFNPKLMMREMPKQKTQNTEYFNYPEQKPTEQKMNAVPLASLTLAQNFFANGWGLSTPNDNDMAISNEGKLISVVNTNIYTKNTVTGTFSPFKSLAAFTTPINSKHQEFDPKVMYDPKADRFVLVCLVGFVDSTSKVIIGFSQTNDPDGGWNLYQLPGNPLDNNLWSDYPMIAMTEKELFLSLNLLVNNQSWQTGFVETIVWQMKKDSGYAGLPVAADLWTNIKFNGKPIRNLCPVKGGSQLYKPNMYFISNRNLANQNDSVFLVNITDTIGAPTATLTTKVMKSNQLYYMPTDARQTNTTQSLATNDSRNLGAFLENGKIQYVHNTNNPANNRPSIYYGVIENPAALNPTVTGYIIPNDTMDFGYPNISYAGVLPGDNDCVIGFDHSSDKVFTGISAIRSDAAGNFSPILRIKNGATYVNLLQANQERWGDYTGSQRRYSSPGEVWMSGYYGSSSGNYPNAHAAWVAQLAVNPGNITSIQNSNSNKQEMNLFPNPSRDMFSVELNLAQPEYLSFELYDLQGKLMEVLLRDWVKVKQNVFSFSTSSLAKGTYILQVKGQATSITKRVVVQ